MNLSHRDHALPSNASEEEIADFLEGQIDELVDQAAQENPHLQAVLPLVRLKVDYTGFSTINVQRFGQRFLKKVANPKEILHFVRRAAAKKGGAKGGRAGDDAAAADALRGMMPHAPGALEPVLIEDLIGKNHLFLLPCLSVCPVLTTEGTL